MKMKWKAFLTTLLGVMLFFAFSNFVFGEEKHDRIRVGFYEFPYFQNIDDNGTYSGYSYDYLQAISQYTGWKYEFVTSASFSECQQMLKDGEIDILGLLLKTPEREGYMISRSTHRGSVCLCWLRIWRIQPLPMKIFKPLMG